MKKTSIRLGVNIDHAATLRQVRGGETDYPNLLQLTQIVKKSGGVQITIHLREDRRHIQDHDLEMLSKKCPLELNLEMAATEEMTRIALMRRPDWCCFVPEKREELTTEGGLDVLGMQDKISSFISRLKAKKILSSTFIEPDLKQVEASHKAGATAVEFHTGLWVRLKGEKKRVEWLRLQRAARIAHQLGLYVHAGHGLDFKSARSVRHLPFLREVNIGHSLICYSLSMGLGKAVKEMKRSLG